MIWYILLGTVIGGVVCIAAYYLFFHKHLVRYIESHFRSKWQKDWEESVALAKALADRVEEHRRVNEITVAELEQKIKQLNEEYEVASVQREAQLEEKRQSLTALDFDIKRAREELVSLHQRHADALSAQTNLNRNIAELAEGMLAVERGRIEEGKKLALLEKEAELGKADEAVRSMAARITETTSQLAELELKRETLENEIKGLLQAHRIEANADEGFRIIMTLAAVEELKELWYAVKRLRVSNPAPLFKAIFELYLRAPLKGMLSGVPETGGIYCITDKVSGKRYVGKTTNFRNRWTEHVKRGGYYEEGTAAGSLLYGAMKEHGVWEFTFEVVEEAWEGYDYSERERYYIGLMETDKELNMRRG